MQASCRLLLALDLLALLPLTAAAELRTRLCTALAYGFREAEG